MNTEISTQIAANQEKQIEREQFNRMRDQGLFEGASLSAKAPDVVGEITPYDFETIFASADQAGRYVSPYGTARNMSPYTASRNMARGGQVEDENDMLLRLLGDM